MHLKEIRLKRRVSAVKLYLLNESVNEICVLTIYGACDVNVEVLIKKDYEYEYRTEKLNGKVTYTECIEDSEGNTEDIELLKEITKRLIDRI